MHRQPILIYPLTGTILTLAAAAAYGWTSPSLIKLQADDSHIPVTNDESSWIAAFMVLGTIVGPIPTAWSVDRFGRKKTLLFAAIPLVAAWFLVGFAKSVFVLYVARFLSGISYGTVYSATPMYLGEIASDFIRGSIGTLLTVMAKTGILFVYAVGPYVSVQALAWILMSLPIVFVLVFIWLPESPYYLVDKNRTEDAQKSLQWLRGNDNIGQELEQMKVAIEKARLNKGTFKELFTRGNRRSLIIVLGLGACQQLCGSQAVIAYAQSFFEKVGSDLGSSESSIILAVVQLITAAFSSSIVDRLGRRPLLLISTSGSAVCTAIIGTYFFLEHDGVDVSDYTMVPFITIMIFIISYTIGLATVPFAILGEIFPSNIKAVAAAVYTMFASAVGFGVIKLYQVVSDDLGIFYTFWGFAVCSLLFVLFVWFLVPETKGKPLAQILEEMGAIKGNSRV